MVGRREGWSSGKRLRNTHDCLSPRSRPLTTPCFTQSSLFNLSDPSSFMDGRQWGGVQKKNEAVPPRMFSADFPVSSRRGGKFYSRPEVSGGHTATAGGLRGPPLQLLVAGRARPWLSWLRPLLLWRLRKYLRRGSRRSSAAAFGQVKRFLVPVGRNNGRRVQKGWEKKREDRSGKSNDR